MFIRLLDDFISGIPAWIISLFVCSWKKHDWKKKTLFGKPYIECRRCAALKKG